MRKFGSKVLLLSSRQCFEPGPILGSRELKWTPARKRTGVTFTFSKSCLRLPPDE